MPKKATKKSQGEASQVIKTEVAVLDKEEAERFEELNKVIDRGMAAFVEVGAALAEVRGSKLYRADFGSWDEYLQKKWGMVRQYANRIIRGSRVMIPSPDSVQCSKAGCHAKRQSASPCRAQVGVDANEGTCVLGK